MRKDWVVERAVRTRAFLQCACQKRRACGRQRRYKVASDTLVFELQFRLRCKGCNGWRGFRITILDARTRGDNWKPRLERVVVAGE